MNQGIEMSFNFFSKSRALLVVSAVLTLMMTCAPALALPQGNAVTDPKAILRNSLPITNPDIRKLQTSIEDISQQIRANRRWGAIGADLTRAETVIRDKRSQVLASVSESFKPQGNEILDAIQGDIDLLRIDVAAKNKDDILMHRSALLSRVTTLEEAMLGDFPYEVPEEYKDLPQLKGRAQVEFTTDKGVVTAVLDGYSAPVTGGNFVDLIQRGFYDGLPFTRAEDFYVLQTGDPDGPDEGFIDPKTKAYRSVPLEILAQGDKVPTYGVTLEDAGRYLDQPVLPFSAYGAIAMARPNEEANGGSSQFFFFLFEPELTPAGLNLLDGRYSIFGYVTGGQEVLHEIKAGDKINSVKVVTGLDKFKKGAA